jgi:UDP-glucose 4-epimerase
MTRALVTGGCGFVGSALCSQLMETGREVIALDDLRLGSADSLPTGVRLTVADVRDPALERILVAHRPDVVFHLAAIHFVPACEDEPAEAISVNVEGTQRVLAASAAAGAAAVVLASSAAVYAPSPAPHRETSALGPTDVYGHTKLWAEQLASLHNARTGQSIGVARLFNVYGPGETNPHLIPTIIEQAKRGPELHLGNLETSRTYVHVGDAVEALVALAGAACERGHAVCNIGGARGYRGKEIVEAIGRRMKRDLVVALDETRFRRSDRPWLAADLSRAASEMNWRPTTNFDDGLAETIERPLASGVKVG